MDPRKPGLWIAIFAAIGFGAAIYVLSAGTQAPRDHGWDSFARATLSKLEVREDAPPMPSRYFETWGGEPAQLQSLQGQVVMVNLWATWCAPCVAEMPSLNAVQKRFADQPFQVVPISLDRTLAEAAEFYEEMQLDALPLWGDNTLSVGSDMAAAGVPTTVIYNRRGEEVVRLSSEADWNSEEAVALIEAVLNDPSDRPASS